MNGALFEKLSVRCDDHHWLTLVLCSHVSYCVSVTGIGDIVSPQEWSAESVQSSRPQQERCRRRLWRAIATQGSGCKIPNSSLRRSRHPSCSTLWCITRTYPTLHTGRSRRNFFPPPPPPHGNFFQPHLPWLVGAVGRWKPSLNANEVLQMWDTPSASGYRT